MVPGAEQLMKWLRKLAIPLAQPTWQSVIANPIFAIAVGLVVILFALDGAMKIAERSYKNHPRFMRLNVTKQN